MVWRPILQNSSDVALAVGTIAPAVRCANTLRHTRQLICPANVTGEGRSRIFKGSRIVSPKQLAQEYGPNALNVCGDRGSGEQYNERRMGSKGLTEGWGV